MESADELVESLALIGDFLRRRREATRVLRTHFVEGFDEYLRMKIEIARRDREHFERTGNAVLRPLTDFWEGWYAKVRGDFHDRYRGDIVDGFRSLQDRGHIEVLTSGATHGYFALLSRDESVR